MKLTDEDVTYMEKQLFHITSPKNICSILTEGLKANEDGDIFLFEDKAILNTFNGNIIYVADNIALNQIFQSEYAMFAIDNDGIEVEPIPDDVAELSARHQWIIKQPIIEPDYLELCDIYTAKGWHNPKENEDM